MADKLIHVTATYTTEYIATVRVPEGTDEDEVLEWYKANGANGEFSEYDDGEWTWGEATEADESDIVGEDIYDLDLEAASRP